MSSVLKITKRKKDDSLEIVYDPDPITEPISDPISDPTSDSELVPNLEIITIFNCDHKDNKSKDKKDDVGPILDQSQQYQPDHPDHNQPSVSNQAIVSLSTDYVDTPYSDLDLGIDVETDATVDSLHYLAILPVVDYLYEGNITENSSITGWFYRIQLLLRSKGKIPIFPLDEIDDDFKYKTAVRNILVKIWKITKKSVFKIKHITTEQNIHFYLVVLKNNHEANQVKHDINATPKDKYFWKSYFIYQSILDGLPTKRPYQIQYPSEFISRYHLSFEEKYKYIQGDTNIGNMSKTPRFTVQNIIQVVTSLE